MIRFLPLISDRHSTSTAILILCSALSLTVQPKTLENFIATFRARHLEVANDEGKEFNADDYELTKGEDYILCSENTNRRTVNRTSNLNNNLQEQLKRGLFDLNYRLQVILFEKKISNLKTGSFLIHGAMNHGQQWLVNRLSYNIPYHDTAFR